MAVDFALTLLDPSEAYSGCPVEEEDDQIVTHVISQLHAEKHFTSDMPPNERDTPESSRWNARTCFLTWPETN